MIFEGTYSKKVAKELTLADSGEEIAPGQTFYFNEDANSSLTINEAETQILGLRDFSQAKRDQLAKEGKAMKDGSYPIENCQDVKNALRRIGTGSNNSKQAIIAHIKKRAKALACNVPNSSILN